jgi:hypothetical protein
MAKKKHAKPFQKVELAALKALITLYGARGAARMAKVPAGTMLCIAAKYKWKKATGFNPEEQMSERAIDAAELIAKEIAANRESSERNLAAYVKNASEKAAKHHDPLEVARKVRDVAGVYQVLYPPEEEGGLIEGAILIGGAQVTVNPEEVEARARMIDDVRTELPDARPEGD